MPFRTMATLNLQPIRLLTQEDTRFLEPADSPISHTNLWEWEATQHKGDTLSSVYDCGINVYPRHRSM